ncbi:MAG: hypothetical protein LBS11_04785 [Oscillospiraceae bacterium]|jgi:hypothetical protein|nr:hypothetical protein [Oscillospiraceae bacterium]
MVIYEELANNTAFCGYYLPVVSVEVIGYEPADGEDEYWVNVCVGRKSIGQKKTGGMAGWVRRSDL